MHNCEFIDLRNSAQKWQSVFPHKFFHQFGIGKRLYDELKTSVDCRLMYRPI